jgi:hypothetical protein
VALFGEIFDLRTVPDPKAKSLYEEQLMRTPSTIFTESDYLRAHITIMDMQPRGSISSLTYIVLRITSRLEKWTFPPNAHLVEARAKSNNPGDLGPPRECHAATLTAKRNLRAELMDHHILNDIPESRRVAAEHMI